MIIIHYQCGRTRREIWVRQPVNGTFLFVSSATPTRVNSLSMRLVSISRNYNRPSENRVLVIDHVNKRVRFKVRLKTVFARGYQMSPLYTMVIQTECLLTWLPHLKWIRLGSVRSGQLPLKMYEVGFRAFKSPYINACRVNSNTHSDILIVTFRTGFQPRSREDKFRSQNSQIIETNELRWCKTEQFYHGSSLFWKVVFYNALSSTQIWSTISLRG